MTRVMFVCLGNICRSPAAEGILKHLVNQNPNSEEIIIESSAMGDWHTGQLPDIRMREFASARGITLISRAQQFLPSFFEKFDYIFAADHQIKKDLYLLAKHPDEKAKIHLMTAFSPCYKDKEVPDPYHLGDASFQLVLDMLEDCCEGFLEHLKEKDK